MISCISMSFTVKNTSQALKHISHNSALTGGCFFGKAWQLFNHKQKIRKKYFRIRHGKYCRNLACPSVVMFHWEEPSSAFFSEEVVRKKKNTPISLLIHLNSKAQQLPVILLETIGFSD